jgi:hypothetical protein
MKTKITSSLVLGLLLTAGSDGPVQSQTIPDKESVTIMVGVYDYAHTKAADLFEAERTATAVLRKAGIEMLWLACPTANASADVPSCATVDPTHLTLHLLCEAVPNRLQQVHGDALGFAALGEKPSRTAWVFADRVKVFAVDQRLIFARLLGAVIAHELGHLLLDETEHSNAGLMHSYWTRQELLAIECGVLQFSDAESKRVQSGARARQQVASAAVAEVSLSHLPARLD